MEIQQPNDWFEGASNDPEDAYPISEYDITTNPNDFNIKTIFAFMESGVVHIPEFQRCYVWDIKRASRLIESLILGLPIPQIFLYEEHRNKFLVIDGQQRLLSIFYFMQQRFPRMEKRAELKRITSAGKLNDSILHDDKYFMKFNLRLPSMFSDKKNKFDGLNYSTLGQHKIDFDLRTIRNVIIKQNSTDDDDSAIYEIFNRLNTGGVNLSPQEIRTSLYHSDFYNMLYSINQDERWRKILAQEELDLHKRDIEILLRSFALLLIGDKYSPSMTRFINGFSKKCKSMDDEKILRCNKIADAFFSACTDLGEKPFHSSSMKFSIPLFESVFYAAGKISQNIGIDKMPKITHEYMSTLKSDAQFVEAIRDKTTDTSNVQNRLQRAFALLREASHASS